MAKINFIVKSKQEGQPSTVYVRYSDIQGIDFMVTTKEKIFPEKWSNGDQSFKQRILYNDSFTEKDKIAIEERLTEIKAFINKEYFLLKGAPVSNQWFKETINKFYGNGSNKNENLTQYIERYINEAKSGKRLAIQGRTKKHYSYHSLRSMRGFKLSLEKFSESTGKKYNFDDITVDWYNDFIQFFYDRKCGDNYIGTHIRHLKAIMRAAREEGLHNNRQIEQKAFKTVSEEVDNIYLTEAELKKLFDLDLSDNQPYQFIRDVFLVGCYTAQRYSDYSVISKSNVKIIGGRKFIELKQGKTGEKVIIPIKPECDAILQRYDYTLPKTLQLKLNTEIKKIAAMAGITEIVNQEKIRGGMKVKTKVKKCNLITGHVARRTGCSLMVNADIPIFDIMAISGHRTPDEFLKYVRLTKEEIAIKLSSHPYFIGNPLSIAK
jgi:hypothetical protein